MAQAPGRWPRRHGWTVWRLPTDTGSASLETALLMPAILALTSLVVFGGRYAMAIQAVEVAAGEAARVASLARSPGPAQQEAEAVTARTLASRGLACSRTALALDTSGLSAPAGTPATATATVSCTVQVSDLMPLAPGTRTLTATAVSPIDTYRE